jgi:hypothetical protein
MIPLIDAIAAIFILPILPALIVLWIEYYTTKSVVSHCHGYFYETGHIRYVRIWWLFGRKTYQIEKELVKNYYIGDNIKNTKVYKRWYVTFDDKKAIEKILMQ